MCSGAIDEATRLLDNERWGLSFPHVDTAKQARHIADVFRYPPQGHRSWGGPLAVYGDEPPAVAEAQAAINGEILTVVMIESPEAVENAEHIAAVDGIDVLLIGSFDLTSALGVAGQMDMKLIDAYAEVCSACRKHGKVLGMGGINGDEDARRYVGMGARFITTGSDYSSYVVAGALARANFLRGLKVGKAS